MMFLWLPMALPGDGPAALGRHGRDGVDKRSSSVAS
jgi:hypothetical protein